jgi:hypothetical protein
VVIDRLANAIEKAAHGRMAPARVDARVGGSGRFRGSGHRAPAGGAESREPPAGFGLLGGFGFQEALAFLRSLGFFGAMAFSAASEASAFLWVA